MAPVLFNKYCEVFEEKELNRVREVDYLNYILGKYIGIAVNAPTKYPDHPLLSKEKEDKIMTSEEMEAVSRRNVIKLGGIIKNANTN